MQGIRDNLLVHEHYLAFNVKPWSGVYIYAEGTQGTISDNNKSTSVAAGVGANIFAMLGILPRQSLTVKYDHYYLNDERISPLYFSPSGFRVGTPGLEWRIQAAATLTVGLEGGIPINTGGTTGYLAGAFFGWQASPKTFIEGRVKVLDDTQYRITSFTLGPRFTF